MRRRRRFRLKHLVLLRAQQTKKKTTGQRSDYDCVNRFFNSREKEKQFGERRHQQLKIETSRETVESWFFPFLFAGWFDELWQVIGWLNNFHD